MTPTRKRSISQINRSNPFVHYKYQASLMVLPPVTFSCDDFQFLLDQQEMDENLVEEVNNVKEFKNIVFALEEQLQANNDSEESVNDYA